MDNIKEIILMMLMKANKKEDALVILEDYIQQNGPVSNETGETIKKILEEKERKIPISAIEQMIAEIKNLPDTVYSDNIMDVNGVSWKRLKDKVIEIINKYIE